MVGGTLPCNADLREQRSLRLFGRTSGESRSVSCLMSVLPRVADPGINDLAAGDNGSSSFATLTTTNRCWYMLRSWNVPFVSKIQGIKGPRHQGKAEENRE